MLKQLIKLYLLLIVLLMLSGCSTMKPEDYADATPALDLFSYFDGQTQAWGMFQDRFGEVKRRFKVEINGQINGDQLTLDEAFQYDDGETQRRIWTIQRLSEHNFQGTADDVVGVAEGTAYGNALNWRYDLLLALGEKQWQVKFNDWMFLQDDKVLINRAKLSKYGFMLGEVTLVFQKP